ncbi:hypothetical protein KIPB_011864, partial [Kipferlia bialata]|eukprot:g11864.t1
MLNRDPQDRPNAEDLLAMQPFTDMACDEDDALPPVSSEAAGALVAKKKAIEAQLTPLCEQLGQVMADLRRAAQSDPANSKIVLSHGTETPIYNTLVVAMRGENPDEAIEFRDSYSRESDRDMYPDESERSVGRERSGSGKTVTTSDGADIGI